MRILLFYLVISFSFICSAFSQDFSWQQKDRISDALTKQMEIIKISVEEILKKKDPLSPEEKNAFIHFVLDKDAACENITDILVKEFLQKKMLCDDEHLTEKLSLVQKIMQKAYQLKFNVDQIIVQELEMNIDELKKIMSPQRNYHREYNYYRYRDN